MILDGWSRNPRPVPDDLRLARRTVPRLFEERVRKSPDDVAAVFFTPGGDVSLTYGELNGLANRLARRLRALGVGPEERVAIHMEAGLDRVIAVLAVLKAGGAYVPLDPAYPKALVHELVVDCGPRVVLTQSRLADTLSGCAAPQVIVLDDASADTASDPADDLPGNPDDDLTDGAELRHAAYLIYTSGSTGRRKGVLVSHDSFRAGIEALIDAFRVRTASRVLQLASFSFDASVSEFFTTLVMGARLYMAPRDVLIPSAEMVRLLNRWRIDNAIFPVSVLARLPAGELPDLRTMMVGGEACPAELTTRWAGGRSMINAYGPTETTICTCVAVLKPDGTKPLIGRPCGEARFYILDGGMNPVPVGAVGHLHIGGPVVTRGYWGRPALTATSFVPDPFSDVPGSRLYRTGDLARFLADGSIDCLGRIDDQLKIRGVRIEPGEIEAVLLEDPSMREAAVLAVGDTPESRRLVAFVVPESGGEAMTGVPAELRERLRQRLPGYMVPAPIIPLGRLPLSTSGKIDRRALAIVAASEIAGGSGHRSAAALNETETAVARIWQDLLKLDGIGLDANFFDLGGHSLMLLNVQERLQADTGVQIDVTDLFKYPTVAALADHLAKSRNRDQRASDPPPAAGRTRAAARQEALDRAARRRANPLAEVR
jgi:amino acid adenylation domain-containing protein